MSGFTLVIVVMLIMFAAIAIVLTQGDGPESMESSAGVEPIPPASDDVDALPSNESSIIDEPSNGTIDSPLVAPETDDTVRDEDEVTRLTQQDE